MKITISVTADDINRGAPECSTGCPVWLAAKRMLPGFISVGPDSMAIADDGREWLDVSLPPVAAAFIRRFDNCQPVEPFSFDLNVPDELIPAGAS